MDITTPRIELVCDALAPHRAAPPAGAAKADLLCRLGLHEWSPWSEPFCLGGPILLQSRACRQCGTERRRYE